MTKTDDGKLTYAVHLIERCEADLASAVICSRITRPGMTSSLLLVLSGLKDSKG